MASPRQQLQGVVIITLPPADNPSKGKTITSIFTLSDSLPSQEEEQQQQQQPNQDQIPIRSSPDTDHRFFYSPRFLYSSPRRLLGLLGISLLSVLLWASLSSNTLYELRSSSSEDDRELNSFIFTLYPKLGNPKKFQIVQRDAVSAVAMIDDKAGLDEIKEVDSSTIFPVRGNIYPHGLYYISMFVGNPPRPYYLDIDTGSDLTWIQCDAPCISCAKGPHPLYKPTKGKIVPPKDMLCAEVQNNQKCRYGESCQQCDYEIEYADHSSSMGVLARDELNLKISNGTLVKPSFVFGCAYNQQGQLSVSPAKTDGILGLNRATISLSSQLARQGIIRNVVGHCITSDSDGGGYLFLGDDFLPQWGMTWIPMLNSPSRNFYHTEIVKISYGSGQLSLGGLNNGVGKVIFDSGSSYTYFTKQAYSDLIASLKDDCGEKLVEDKSDPTLPVCWQAESPIRSLKEVKAFFKPLTLRFGSKWWIVSKKLMIPPEAYLIISNKGNVCLGILDGSEVHDGSTIILGDISLRGQLVVYDNVNEKIGWIQSDCVKPPTRFESFPFF